MIKKKKMIILLLSLLLLLAMTTTALADEDGSSVEIGMESIEDYSNFYNETGLNYGNINTSTDCVEGLEDIVDDTSTSWLHGYDWEDMNVWEKDFKSSTESGNDYRLTDDVDLVAFCGHGLADLTKGPVMTDVDHDGAYVVRDTVLWGDRDLEWALMFTCNFLTPHIDDIGSMMNGVHMICGYRTVMWVTANGGEKFAARAIAGYSVKDSWNYYASQTQPALQNQDVKVAKMYHTSTESDKLWGYGTVASDPTPFDTSSSGYYISYMTLYD